jgi:hypothetical protein
MTWWLACICALPIAAFVFLIFRIRAFRVDRPPWEDGYFGDVPLGLSQSELWTPSNYTPRGQRILPWLFAALILSVIGFIPLLFYIVDKLY